MKLYTVYVIQSKKTKDLYFGFTTNLSERLKHHNDGINQSTKFGIPWILVYCESYRSEEDARAREKGLKHYGNARTYIKKRIKESLVK